MSLVWLDSKYVSMLSFRLRNFKNRGSNSWNFSCPFCGDSKTDKRKARGYIFERKGKLQFYCHNCHVPNVSVRKLLEFIDSGLYTEYLKESLEANVGFIERPKSDVQIFAEKMKAPVFVTNSPLKHLKKISKFRPESAVKAWVDGRMLPQDSHYRLFFCKEFKHWINEYCLPNKFDKESLVSDEPRLVIPFLDEEGNLFAVQGRSFKKNANVRYFTIILDEDKPKIFGLDKLDKTKKPIYVCEGPLDSLFIPNCIASAGADLISNLSYVSNNRDDFTIIFDNEPRNSELHKLIEKAINTDYPVVIWPESIQQKDINEMVLAGYTQQKVVDIINENTYSGLEARLKFSQWKKV